MKTKVILFTLMITLLLCFVGCNKNNQKKQAPISETNFIEADINMMNLPDIIASVNGDIISKEQYIYTYTQMKSSLEEAGIDSSSLQGITLLETIKKDAISQLLEETVLKQAALQDGIEVSDEIALKEIEAYKVQFKSLVAFNKALEKMQLTEEELLTIYKSEIAINIYLKSQIKDVIVRDEEVKESYDDYVLYLKKSNTNDIPDFEVVKDTLRNEIMKNGKKEKIKAFIDQLIKNSDVIINY